MTLISIIKGIIKLEIAYVLVVFGFVADIILLSLSCAKSPLYRHFLTELDVTAANIF